MQASKSKSESIRVNIFAPLGNNVIGRFLACLRFSRFRHAGIPFVHTKPCL